MSEEAVFVYGTLRRGDCRNGALEGYECLSREAHLQGFHMKHLGGFPAIVPDPDQKVLGEIYRIDKECLAQLDRIEGHPHFYRRTKVLVFDVGVTQREIKGETKKVHKGFHCWTYVFADPSRITDCPIIKSGDWFSTRRRGTV